MSKKLLTSLFAACACVALGAQAPATSSQSAPPAASPQSRDQSAAKPDTVTVAGCVERNTAPAAASGAVGTSGSASAFILSSVSKPTGTSGSTTPPALGAVASSYRLEGDDSKITPHVGHKVEITGTVDKTMASSAANPTSSTAANAPILKVDSVKMVAASCTP